MDADVFADVVKLACEEMRVERVPPNNRPAGVVGSRCGAPLPVVRPVKGRGHILASPGEVEKEVEKFVAYYNTRRYHVPRPDGPCFGRRVAILRRRAQLKTRTMRRRRPSN